MGVCGQNICHHVAALVIPFNLICTMTMFLKKLNFDLLTPPPWSGGEGWGSTGKIFSTILLHFLFHLI